jgi:predicted membrane protein
MPAKLLLILAATGLVPIALSYGFAPGVSLQYLLGISVESTNHAHVFRAIMGLYLANAMFWLIAAFRPNLQHSALWVLCLFMTGLAAGRILSIVVDGMPNMVLMFYLVAELAFGSMAARLLLQKKDVE